MLHNFHEHFGLFTVWESIGYLTSQETVTMANSSSPIGTRPLLLVHLNHKFARKEKLKRWSYLL